MSNEKEVEAINAFLAELVKKTKVTLLFDKGSNVVFVEPTAEELSSLTFAKLRDIRIHTQDLRNRFASVEPRIIAGIDKFISGLTHRRHIPPKLTSTY